MKGQSGRRGDRGEESLNPKLGQGKRRRRDGGRGQLGDVFKVDDLDSECDGGEAVLRAAARTTKAALAISQREGGFEEWAKDRLNSRGKDGHCQLRIKNVGLYTCEPYETSSKTK